MLHEGNTHTELSLSVIEERVRVRAGAGTLEGVLSYPMESARRSCLLVPPHPFMGGTLDNNVLRFLAGAMAEAGIVSLRFNYRGVGASDGDRIDVLAGMQQFWQTGTAPQDPLLIEDARAARTWLSGQCALPQILIGYSFGAYAAVCTGMEAVATPFSGVRRDEAHTQTDLCGPPETSLVVMILILPTLRQHDFSAIAQCAAPKLIIYSDDDFATPREVVEPWVATLPDPKRAVCIPGGQHFFRGLEPRVAACCLEFLNDVGGTCDAD